MPEIVTVEVNCPDEATAVAIAEAAVTRRLAASANVGSPVASLYRWRGRVERAREVPVVLKTRAERVPALARAIGDLHPYATPAILVRAVEPATANTRDWIIAETRDGA